METILVTGGSGFIGTHVIEHLAAQGHHVINYDVQRPKCDRLATFWREGSIMDPEKLRRACMEVRPRHIIHLAAIATMEARSLEELRPNFEGTRHVLEAAQSCGSVERVIVTSSQHVRRPGAGLPLSDTDYVPYKLYGKSKVRAEEVTRSAALDFTWTIVRPTAVWGPGNLGLADGLWRQLARGRYLHPKADPVIRAYGYVKNLAWQLERILCVERRLVDRKTLYVADANLRQQDWVTAMAVRLAGRRPPEVPRSLLRVVAVAGDAVRACGGSFPLYSSRLENLLTSNPVPVEPALRLLGTPPYSLEAGMDETADWLRAHWRA